MNLSIRLVSGGDTLSVWDGTGYEPVYTYRPTSGSKRISLNSWNTDGNCIASCIEGSDKIILTHLKGTNFASVEETTTLGITPVCVQYPRTSAKLLVVGSTDKVFLYDVGKQKTRKEFKLTNDAKLKTIATNFNDNYIAVGATGGYIFLLNSVTGQTGIPMKSIKLQNVTSVKYSKVRHSLLGSSGESGQVALWDCNTNKQTHIFSEHNAPATSVAFSPVNEVLLLSSGLDKRCVCYDTQTKRPASTIKTDQPLSSVDFFSDGMTLALGTTHGKIIIYDLRSLKSPSKVISAHIGPVKNVLYRPPISDRPTFVSSSKNTSSSSKLSSQISKKNLALNMKENLPSISENSIQNLSTEASSFGGNNFGAITGFDIDNNGSETSERKESLSSQIFSPIRDVADIFSPLGSGSAFGSSGCARRSSVLSNTRLSHESIFSPLRESSLNAANNSLIRTPTGNLGSSFLGINEPPVFESPLAKLAEESTGWFQKDVSKTDFSNFQSTSTPWLQSTDQSKTTNLKEEHATIDDVDYSNAQKTATAWLQNRELSKVSEVGQSDLSKSNTSWLQRKDESKVNQPSFQHTNISLSTSMKPTEAFTAHRVESQAVDEMNAIDKSKDVEVFDVEDIDASSNVESAAKKRKSSTNKDKNYSDVKLLLTAFPHAMELGFQVQGNFSEGAATNLTSQSRKTTSQSSKGLTVLNEEAGQFRDDYFRGLVQDAMQEFCSDMKRHLWHIHYDNIRHFDRQRIEIEQLLHHERSVNESLASEVAKLREENEILKISPFILNTE